MSASIASALALALLVETGKPSQGKQHSFDVDGTKRQAVVHASSLPALATGAPLVLVFHGHSGQGDRAADRFKLHEHWPEAVVAYMQGLPGQPGVNDPEGDKSGWQKTPGSLGDRDVRFFDVALDQLQAQHKIDPDRVYLLGHSNGARFANVLWNTRGEKLAALCSAAAQGGRLIRDSRPKPLFMILGEQDRVAPFNGQLRSVELARELLRTDASKARTEGLARTEPGRDGTELVVYIHPGGHEYPEDATPLVVKFFERHKRR